MVTKVVAGLAILLGIGVVGSSYLAGTGMCPFSNCSSGSCCSTLDLSATTEGATCQATCSEGGACCLEGTTAQAANGTACCESSKATVAAAACEKGECCEAGKATIAAVPKEKNQGD